MQFLKAAALKRADKAVEKLLDRDRPSLGANAKKKSAGKQQRVEQPSTVEPLTPLALKSEAIGQNGPAGSESDGQLRAVRLPSFRSAHESGDLGDCL